MSEQPTIVSFPVVLPDTRANFCPRCGLYTGQVPTSWPETHSPHQCDHESEAQP